jgi:hypothetical protein
MSAVVDLARDEILFPALQTGLILFAILCAVISRLTFGRREQTGFSAVVKRGPTSMAYFYGAYLALTGIFVALSLQVEIAREHRVAFVVLDTILIAYICLINGWFRNKVLGWINRVAEIEYR